MRDLEKKSLTWLRMVNGINQCYKIIQPDQRCSDLLTGKILRRDYPKIVYRMIGEGDVICLA